MFISITNTCYPLSLFLYPLLSMSCHVTDRFNVQLRDQDERKLRSFYLEFAEK